MADEDHTDKPLAHLAETEAMLADEQPEAEPDAGARARLRAFEDRVFGEDAPRIDGAVERGHGSRFNNMTDEERAEYEALERLVKAEDDLKAATDAARAAEENYAAASEAADHYADE